MDNVTASINAEINALANQLRGMRVTGVDSAQVRALEERLRKRWADLRAHRAGANTLGGASAPPVERRHTRW